MQSALDNGQKVLPEAFSFHSSLLQVIDGGRYLALCPSVLSQTPQHSDLPRRQPFYLLCRPVYVLGHFPRLRHVQSSTFIHRTLRMWMSNIDTSTSVCGYPIDSSNVDVEYRHKHVSLWVSY